jgi:hypothetical protein
MFTLSARGLFSNGVRAGLVLMLASFAQADTKKSAEDQRIELLRGLASEFATVKTYLPRSRQALDFESDGTWNKEKWQMIGRELGPAARVGDQVQVTKVDIGKDAITLQINGGMKGKNGKWYDHIEVGMGGSTSPVSNRGNPTNAPGGTTITVHYREGIGDLTAADVKKVLTPVLDFEKHSVTEQYVDTLPPEIKQAVLEKKVIEGMDRDQVLLALGRPNRKTREAKDGVDLEDWIFGEPPGRVTFVTFSGPKVVKIKETYAGLGGSIAEQKNP